MYRALTPTQQASSEWETDWFKAKKKWYIQISQSNDPPARQGPLLKPPNITGDIVQFVLLFQGDQGIQRAKINHISLPTVSGQVLTTRAQ